MKSLRSSIALAAMSGFGSSMGLSGAAMSATLFPDLTYRPRSPKKQNKVSQAKRRKYKRQGRK
jgi:hypothetical protein